MLFGNRIAPVHTVRDLWVMLDNNLTMSQHVLSVCQNCYFQIRLIRRLGKALSVESKLLLVHALIHNKLDYCNSFLTCLPWSLVHQLQSVLNSAPRLIFGLKGFDRKQFVSVNNYTSSVMVINYRAPQDSVLGPLLFLLYINDIKYADSAAILNLFADDTSLFVFDKDPIELFNRCNHSLNAKNGF